MTTPELIAIIHRRGLALAMRDHGPAIVRPDGSKAVTDKLLAVLTIHRESIIASLKESNHRKETPQTEADSGNGTGQHP